ncbi:MAG TPA: polyprenyl synthetase family protein [Turneriella sp.]|nr:polyprenyl synthetase family protein [Turneriella sp.]HNA79048.1 polyprenyl synthetase family protein [Turneriella sp.]HNE18201.1 polyprenyl synthetase family protein [Turneriella sp.]HNJ66310.1 polyprenyl synthetase family protein [Turneriella sp.]HNL10923.1 polyprenyl synthetase family protein [Turneriella sp.]
MLYSPARVISDTNKTIASILQGDLRILKKIAAYVVESGGKRIRPLFMYYLGRACRIDSRELIELGALLEIVHAASLLHDDVIDGADERRSRPTGAKLFGNKQVVLGGDHLLSSGLKYLNGMQNSSYMTIFTDAIQALSAAELLQMQQHFNLKTSRKLHDRVVDGKTAALFRAAGALVSVMRGEKDFYHTDIADLGLTLGRFFQERDDHLDYFDAARLKKKGLQDFLNGIVTYPLLLLLSSANRTESGEIRAEWEFARLQGKIRNQERILNLMKKYDVERRSADELRAMQKQILAGIGQLPEPKARQIISTEFEKILAVRSP